MILDKLRLRKKKAEGPTVSRSEILSTKPVRNPYLKWEKNDKGDICIKIPLQQTTGLFSKLMPTPRERKIELDKIGSMVWELCDGNRTVKDLADFLHEEYKLMIAEAEISLNTYLDQLSKRGLIGFIFPEETRVRYEQFFKEKGGKDKDKKK